MSTHDNEPANQDEGQQQTPSQQPEPSKEAKAKAHEMMSAYEDLPTLVLPGSGGAISGTAINDWLDDEGNCKYGKDETPGDETFKDKIATDNAFNQEVIKAATDEKTAASK
ncbi:MAG: hypothetical protein ACXVGG_09765 [Mycobacteriaceae bacterium]